MTLLEVLLSLALLSALAVASAGLVGLAAATATGACDRERWRAAAEAATDCVERDLTGGDFDVTPDVNRVMVHGGTLAITTRGVGHDGPTGPAVHEYRFDTSRGLLLRDERSLPPGRRGTGRVEGSRRLIGEVSAWSATIDPKTGQLSIAMSGPVGQRLERRIQTR